MDQVSSAAAQSTGFLAGGGAMGAQMRAHDWGATSLGPLNTWPQSLRTAVSLMLNSLHPMFLAWGPDLVFLYNDGYAPILGEKHPGALGRPFQRIWSEIWEDIYPLIERALSGEATWSEDLHLIMERHGYPEDTWYTFSYSPVVDESGQVGGMFCACTETTSKVLSDRRLKLELEFSEALREIRDPVEVTATAARVLGQHLRPSRVGYGAITAGGARIRITQEWTADGVCSAAGQEHDLGGLGEGVLSHLKAGRVLRVDDTGGRRRSAPSPERYPDADARAIIVVPLIKAGRFTAVLYVHEYSPRLWSDFEIALVEDVAERTWAAVERARAEAALQAQLAAESERLKSLFQSAPSFIAVVRGPEHVFELANPAYLDLVGRGDIVGQSVREALPDVAGQGFFELLDRVYTSGEPFFARDAPVKLNRGAADIEERFVDFIYQPIKEEGGEVTGIFVEGHDVTDRHLAHQELAQLNATLEHRVEQRSLELTQAEDALRQAQKMEAVGQLTGGIAHDFNNLLTGIIGGLEIVQRRLAVGRYADLDRFIEASITSANRAAGLTHRLLAFSRRQTLAPRPIVVNELIESMADLFHRTIGENVDLRLELAPDAWLAEADANQLESALLNLVINARDAMPDGGRLVLTSENRTLDAAAAQRLELTPGEYVALGVSDTGVGMPQTVVDRAFDPFFTTKPFGQGTGLGLSMIYGFARQSRGQVQIESRVGEGSVVRLFIPRYVGDAPPVADSETEEAPRALAGECVLVVEDDQAVRMLVTEVLRELGYDFIEADDAKAALPVLESNCRIDLMVSDVGLPGMNGRQLADLARQLRPEMKVLFITGYAENVATQAGLLGRDMEVITKPFALDSLAAKIREMIRQREG